MITGIPLEVLLLGIVGVLAFVVTLGALVLIDVLNWRRKPW